LVVVTTFYQAWRQCRFRTETLLVGEDGSRLDKHVNTAEEER
jgi:hypothetical protein